MALQPSDLSHQGCTWSDAMFCSLVTGARNRQLVLDSKGVLGQIKEYVVGLAAVSVCERPKQGSGASRDSTCQRAAALIGDMLRATSLRVF
jgi:hypothetical protein